MRHLLNVRRKRGADVSMRQQLIALMGQEVVRFQDESSAFDDVAARVLSLDRGDLPCMTTLLFGGPVSVEKLSAALTTTRSVVAVTVGRLETAGYARRRSDPGGSLVELSEHARQWIERIWEPLRDAGVKLLSTYSTRDLALMRAFMVRAREVQERQLRTLRTWLEHPAPHGRGAHLRGGLAPAA